MDDLHRDAVGLEQLRWLTGSGEDRRRPGPPEHRIEVLIAESQVAPTFSSTGCTVTAGRWVSFYDDQTYTLTTQVQIDHLIPVAEAWGSGAQT